MMFRFNCAATVDIIIRKNDKVVLVERGHDPYKGKISLPGGFVEENETVEHAAIREAEEETGLKIKIIDILGVYSDPGRDPRGRTISSVFIADAAGGKLKGASDAKRAVLLSLSEIPKNLAFDHSKIISDYMKWLNKKAQRG